MGIHRGFYVMRVKNTDIYTAALMHAIKKKSPFLEFDYSEILHGIVRGQSSIYKHGSNANILRLATMQQELCLFYCILLNNFFFWSNHEMTYISWNSLIMVAC